MGAWLGVISFFVFFGGQSGITLDRDLGNGVFLGEIPSPLVYPGFQTQRGPGKRVEKGDVLIADPKLQGSYFEGSVILITNHGTSGSMGVIVNRPTTMRLFHVLPKIKGLKDRADILYLGGPVSPQSMVLLLQTQHLFDSSHLVFDDIYFSGDMETLLNIIKKAAPEDEYRVYSGYAGWGPGQLEGELARGVWRVLRAFPNDIFNEEPESVWERLIRRSTQQFIQKRENMGAMKAGLTDSGKSYCCIWALGFQHGVC